MNALKKLLPFLGSYWLMLALGVVAILALPAAFFFAQMLNSGFTEEFQRQASEDYEKATKSKNAYSLPGMGGDRVLEKSGDLNAELIAWYTERWQDTEVRTAAVWEEGLKFNRADHEPLIQGLFPVPPDLERDVKIRELIDAVIKFHQRLLDQAHAGAPPSPADLAEQVNDRRSAFIETAKAQRGPGDLDSAEKDRLSRELVEFRVDRCKRRASELAFYADMSVFEGILLTVPTKAPTLAQAWDYQERCWIHSDLVRAVANANKSSASGIPGGVVKRVLRIAARSPGYDPANPATLPPEPGGDRVPVDLTRRISGRASGPGSANRWYDTRDATIEVIISSKRIPAFIDALAATNFITVLDTELTPVSTHDHLRDGYFYADEHVVQARFQVECVLLREWRKEIMPDAVKQALAIPVPAPDAPQSASPNAPKPSSPPAGRRQD